MDSNEIEFIKYKQRGPYHWAQNSCHPFKSNSFVKGRYLKCIELLKQKIQSLHGKKVLDLGCGDGVLSFLLWKEGADVLGVDTSEIAVQYAIDEHKKHNTACTFLVGTGCAIECESNSFDAVLCSDVIEHTSEPLLLLKEIKRVLKEDGCAVLRTPIRFTEAPLDKMHVAEWFQEEFKGLVSSVFKNGELHESHPLFWMEFMNRSIWHRLAVNIISYFNNPFIAEPTSWRYNSLQYMVITR